MERRRCDGFNCQKQCKRRGADDWTTDGDRDFCPRCSWRRGDPDAVTVYAGMPELGGRLPLAAQAAEIPVMVSANRFRKGRPVGSWRSNVPDLAGLRVVLDSAGFVAMKLYGRYPWTVAEYVQLATRLRPIWWASMDLCCEPELDQETSGRQIATTALLMRCRGEALRAGIEPPMPVVQGWEPESYLRHLDALDRVFKGAWPRLLGVGSVCRRSVAGKAGVVRVLEALDLRLPAGVKLHFFGVKSAALQVLAGSGRLGSADSMAWDYQARMSGTGVEHRAKTLVDWHRRQVDRVASSAPFQQALFA